MRKGRRGEGAALGASLVLAFLYGVVLYHTTGFLYAIADDVIMRDIASGAFTGTPDGHLIFVRYVLGFFLSRLYLLNQRIDWYGFFMAGSLFLGLAAVLYRGLSAKRNLAWKAGYAGVALGLFGIGILPHAAQFEWTISAAFLGTAALYLYITLGKEDRGQLPDKILIWFLLFLTFCIRYDVFFMVMPGFGIVFLWRFAGRKKSEGRLYWKELLLPLVVFACVGAAALIEIAAYPGEQWEKFRRFQDSRSQIYDYTGVPSYEANPDWFLERGLDEHEVRNLRHYALYLVEDMGAEMMEALSEESQRQAETGRKEQLRAGLLLSLGELANPEYICVSLPSLLFFLGILFYAFREQRKGVLLPLLLFLGAEGILWLFLGIAGRLPERVAFSQHLVMMLGMGAYFLLLWMEKEDGTGSERPGKAKQVFVSAAAVLCLAGAVLQLHSMVLKNQEKLAVDDSYQQFKEVCKEEKEKLYFIETFAAEPVGGASVTTHGNPGLNRCLTLGDWYTSSPLDGERLEALGIETVEKTILEDPNTFLVVRDIEDPGFLGTYFSYKYPDMILVCQGMECIGDRNYYLYRPEKREEAG